MGKNNAMTLEEMFGDSFEVADSSQSNANGRRAWQEAKKAMAEAKYSTPAEKPAEVKISHTASPEAVKAGIERKSQYFTFEVYADTYDERQKYAFEYVQRKHGTMFPEYAYILHNRDVYDEDGEHEVMNEDGTTTKVAYKKGDLKKPHYHVVFKLRNRTTAGAMTKFFGGVKMFKVDSVEATMQYFCHDTPNSQHKTPYSPNEVVATKGLQKYLIAVNKNFVQFGELLERCAEGETFAQIYTEVLHSDRSDSEKQELLELLMTKGSVLIQAGNQCASHKMYVCKAIQNEIATARVNEARADMYAGIKNTIIKWKDGDQVDLDEFLEKKAVIA